MNELREVCFTVSTALEKAGIEAVLSGGSAAAIYAPDVLSSLDADFILRFSTDIARAHDVLIAAGYTRVAGMYQRPDLAVTVEFPKGPPAIGSTHFNVRTALLIDGDRTLRILTATESVKDRLAGYYAWDDRSSLQAALLIAHASADIDMSDIELWSRAEFAFNRLTDAVTKFHEFERRLARRKAPP